MCWFQVRSKVNELYIYVYPLLGSFQKLILEHSFHPRIRITHREMSSLFAGSLLERTVSQPCRPSLPSPLICTIPVCASGSMTPALGLCPRVPAGHMHAQREKGMGQRCWGVTIPGIALTSCELSGVDQSSTFGASQGECTTFQKRLQDTTQLPTEVTCPLTYPSVSHLLSPLLVGGAPGITSPITSRLASGHPQPNSPMFPRLLSSFVI